MLKHYIKFAFRNFRSNKVVFAGSLATLCLGALCISLLFSYVHNELTMDSFHKNKHDIYMMTIQLSPESKPTAVDARLFFGFNPKEYPEIEKATMIQKYPGENMKFIYNENIFSPEGIVVDSSFFQVFDFELKIGDKNTILSDPGALIITEDFAKKMFGDQDPIGKKVMVSSLFEDLYTVKGIVEKSPSNSSITYEFIIPYDKEPNKHNRSGGVFLLTNNGFNKDSFVKKIENLGHKHHQFGNSKMNVVPFNSLFFKTGDLEIRDIISRFGDKKVIYTLIAIMLVILIISALNFSNLQIINTNSALKQSAISMVNGAEKQHLFSQKTIEFILLLLLSILIITIGYQLFLPIFNNFTQVEISPPLWKIILINAAVLSLILLLAFIYPAIIIFRIPLIKSLKQVPFLGGHLSGRKAIVVFQYTLTFILLISSIIVVKQLDMLLNQDLGFRHKNIISAKLFSRLPFPLQNGRDFNNYKEEQHIIKAKMDKYEADKAKQKNNYQYVKNELASYSGVVNFAQGYSPLKPFGTPWKRKNSDNEYSSENLLSINYNYEKVFDLEIIEGRFFQQGVDQSRGKQLVINEAAKTFWNITDISQNLLLNKYWDEAGGYKIIGVIKDFNYEHLSVKPKPLLMTFWDDIDENFIIQLQEGKVQEGLQFVEALFNKVNPGEAFQYTFLSDDIAALYQKEKRLSIIYIIFTLIALVISGIGLFTIALYDTQRRIKEIGVRKVNGATINEILFMLNKDFIKWVLIAFIVACPISYYAMSTWLENFAYRTSLSWWVFALAGVFTLIIATLTVSWQSYRAATQNPVESLRDE